LLNRIGVFATRGRVQRYFIKRIGIRGDVRADETLVALLPKFSRESNLGNPDHKWNYGVAARNEIAMEIVSSLGRLGTPIALQHLARLACETDWFDKSCQRYDLRSQAAAQALRASGWAGTYVFMRHLKAREDRPPGWLYTLKVLVLGQGPTMSLYKPAYVPVSRISTEAYEFADALQDLWRLAGRWAHAHNWLDIEHISQALDRKWRTRADLATILADSKGSGSTIEPGLELLREHLPESLRRDIEDRLRENDG